MVLLEVGGGGVGYKRGARSGRVLAAMSHNKLQLRSYAWLSVVVHLPVKKSEKQTDPHGEEKKKTEIKMIVLKIN